MAVLLDELKNPVTELRGLAEILANEEAKEHHPMASDGISQKMALLQKIHDALGECMRDQGQSPAP